MILNNVSDKGCVVDGLFEIVHEVKNSIAVCRGYLDIIDSNKEGDLDKYLSVIRSEINRSVDIISDFMLYRKINIEKEIIDVSLLLKDLCNDMELFVNNEGALFEFKLIDDEIYIDGDYNKLKQVFINLIKNGVEAIDNDFGKISINLSLKGDYCYVFIEDNGCGMSNDVLNKIRISSFTTKENGSGIGVNFSNQIIKMHGGIIEYISNVGVGTKVIVKLPIVML